MWLRILALGLAVAAVGLLVASGPGVRFGLWTLGTGFALLRWASILGMVAFLAALAALFARRSRKGRVPVLVLALLAAAASALVPLEFRRQARSVPPIHDISTDTESPPQFVAVLPLRAGAPNPPAYAGEETAVLQRKGYPGIVPLKLALPPAEAFAKARAAAEAMGWTIVAADPAAGRIEAVDTTFWFGFKDDIVIRVSPADGSSRVDVRSKSRIGRSDAGTNARRISAFLKRLG